MPPEFNPWSGNGIESYTPRDWGGIKEQLRHRIQSVEDRLQDLITSGERLMAATDKVENSMSPAELLARLEKAAIALTPVVRSAFMENYRKAGIGSSPRSPFGAGNRQSPGWLIKLIQATTVKLKVSFTIHDRTLVPRFQITLGGGQATRQQYEIAAAINYGSVHTPRDFRNRIDVPSGMINRKMEAARVGYDAKRTLKKFAQTGTISKRALNAIRRGAKFHGIRATKGIPLDPKKDRYSKDAPFERSVRLDHGVWVSIPFPYFYFDQAQMGKINEVVSQVLGE